MASLSKLVSLGSCGEAGMIGGGCWVLLLRCLSALERLQAALMPGVNPAGGAPFGSGEFIYFVCFLSYFLICPYYAMEATGSADAMGSLSGGSAIRQR